MSRKEALSSFIQQIHGRPVVVKLNSGVDYRGKHFNLTLSKVIKYQILINLFFRCISLFRWLYEYCFGAN